MRPETLSVHVGNEADPATGAVAPPIHLATTFRHGPSGERIAGYEYQREGNPTNDRLREALAALEGGEDAATFASGMAAMTGLLECLPNGARVLIPDDCYTGLRMLCAEYLPERGIEAVAVDMGDLDAVRAACAGGVALLWIETPSNPLMKVSDLAALAEIGRAAGAVVVADNTFATPINQNPLDLGFDVVLHSATKYLNGHSDVTAGIILGAREIIRRARTCAINHGATLDSHACFLLERGLKTLALRVERHNHNTRQVAGFLERHPGVAAVHYPGLPSHPDHALAARQMRGFGGMLSFELRNPGGVDAVLAAFRIIRPALSLGGIESLACLPSRTSHKSLTPEERRNLGIADGLVRLSVGIEDVADLEADLAQALAAAGGAPG